MRRLRKLALPLTAAMLGGWFSHGAVAGSLTAASAALPATVNLSNVGTADWVHWGRTTVNTDVDRKAGVTPQLSNWSPLTVATSPAPSASAVAGYIWSDGTPLGSSAGDKRGLRMFDVGRGVTFAAPADTSIRTLEVYVGAQGAKGNLTATLSDGSAAAVTTFVDAPTTKIGRVVTLTYQANSPGQTLQVSYSVEAHYPVTSKWVSIEGAALKAPVEPPPVVDGSLVGTNAAISGTVSLTTEGTADWIHWGRTADPSVFDRKAGVTPQISNWTQISSNPPASGAAALTYYSWSDGTPLAASAGDKRAIRQFDVAAGLSFTAPADTNSRTLQVYIGAQGAKGKLTATLSDGSATAYSMFVDAPSSKVSRVVTLVYRAGSAGQTLQISYTVEAQYPAATYKWISLEAATLKAAGAPPPPPPPPSSGNLVPNASFEENGQWVFPALGGYSSSQANTGSRSLYLVNNGDAAATSGSYQAAQTRIPNIVPGQEYVASVWVKGQDVVGKDNFGGNAPLFVFRFRNAAGAFLDFVDSASKKRVMEGYDWAPLGTYNWNKRTVHVQGPTNAAQVDVSFRSWFWCISGTTFWDDVSFTPRVVAGRGTLLATYQAETADTRSGGVLAIDEPDFTGTGYFDVTQNNAILEWNNVQGGGSRVVAMRYAWEGGAQPVELFVNGVSQGKKTPVMTGRRGFWATENWAVNMPDATNTVKLVVGKATFAGASAKIQPQVDRMEVYAAQ